MKNKNKNKNQKNVAAAPAAAAPQTDATNTAPIETPTVETIQNAENGGAATVEVTETTATGTVKKTRVPMARVFIDGDPTKGTMLLDNSVDSVKGYVDAFMALPVGSRKGYDNYWAKEDGFTNPESIMKLTPQGIGKMMAILQHRAALYIADGGDLGTEMTNVLTGIGAYEAIAVTNAVKVAQDKAINDALATLTKACGGNEKLAREKLAALFPTASQVAPATVAATATVGDTSAPIADASDNATADDESSVDAEAAV